MLINGVYIEPESVLENDMRIILCDFEIQTDYLIQIEDQSFI